MYLCYASRAQTTNLSRRLCPFRVLFPIRPRRVIVRLCGNSPALTCDGRRWPSWAFVGLRWPVLSFVGRGGGNGGDMVGNG
jgi:hypothetical protein